MHESTLGLSIFEAKLCTYIDGHFMFHWLVILSIHESKYSLETLHSCASGCAGLWVLMILALICHQLSRPISICTWVLSRSLPSRLALECAACLIAVTRLLLQSCCSLSLYTHSVYIAML